MIKLRNPHVLWQAARCFVGDNPPPGDGDRVISYADALGVVNTISEKLIDNAPCAANDRMLFGFLNLPPNYEKRTHAA